MTEAQIKAAQEAAVGRVRQSLYGVEITPDGPGRVGNYVHVASEDLAAVCEMVPIAAFDETVTSFRRGALAAPGKVLIVGANNLHHVLGKLPAVLNGRHDTSGDQLASGATEDQREPAGDVHAGGGVGDGASNVGGESAQPGG